MPQYPCDICGETTADFMITATSNGDTLAVGAECVSAWAEAITSAYDAMVEAQAAENAPPPPPKAKKAAKARKAAPAPQAAADGPETDDDDDWADGYPQGRPGAADRPPNDPDDLERSDTETTSPAADVG